MCHAFELAGGEALRASGMALGNSLLGDGSDTLRFDNVSEIAVPRLNVLWLEGRTE